MQDTPHRSDEPLPARRSLVPPPAPQAGAYDDYPQDPPPPIKKFSARLLFRAMRRHWWQALFLWLAGSSGLIALAYYKIKPTFDAISQVRVDLGDLQIFDTKTSAIDFTLYMQNQVALITSPNVIGAALAHNEGLTNYPLLKDSVDAELDIRQALRVQVIPKTSLIQVEMASQNPEEATAIVNEVVAAYLQQAEATYDASTQKQIDKLKELYDGQVTTVNSQRKAVEELFKSLGAANIDAAKDRNSVSVESYRQFSEQLTHIEIMRIAARSKLDQLRNEKGLPQSIQDEEQLTAAISDAFYADPRVASLQAALDQARVRQKDIERLARSKADPSLVRQAQKVKDYEEQKNALWKKLQPSLRRQIATIKNDDPIEKQIKDAEANLAALTTQEETYRSKLNDLRVENKLAEGQTLKLEFARRDLQRKEEVLDAIRKNLDQRQFQMKNPTARISLEHKARPSNRPNSDRRKQVMAASPVLVGLLVMGLFLLLELHGARVSDPDELVSRIHLQVIGVVPPLPQIRVGSNGGGNGYGNGAGPPATQGTFRAQRQLDEYVQSLDHLRVALCARKDPWGRDRHCVLITSACGSEGKTTLAAQLAERCVNAGMMTLLIDGDLRNPTLSRMLDASENPGLINVLRGEVSAEDVVMVIGDAGGFHLLPAGSPRVDPSRLLQSERLGTLIAQARESFDMIIIDAPPVLPVPDALTIGKWTDGAVLAVRHDTSRFPLVERANRRLTHVGVPVIGAVVNGVRSMESSYGGYYAYGSYGSVSTTPEPEETTSAPTS
ncbi:MAG: hypothetical protein NVSMB9_04390 [Isosphaeraceae bacterium]